MTNFGDLVNIEQFGDKRETFNAERGDVAFYCKDCCAIVEVDRKKPKSYVFTCKNCASTNIAVGTLQGLKDNYRIKG